MSEIVLEATKRTVTGKKVNALRRSGQLPAVIFGRHIEPVAIMLDQKSTTLSLRYATPSTLITVQLDGEKHITLVRDKQYHPIKGSLIHIDFQAISMTEKLRSAISLDFVGIAPAIDANGGILITEMTEIEVECLPKDLIASLSVDISSLAEPGDVIHVKDLKIPNDIEVLNNPDDIVVLVTRSSVESEEAEISISEPEVIEKGKKQEDFEN